MISIITVSFNNKAGLEQTVKSVMSQTYKPYIEYIIIDGGSTDGSRDVLGQYSDSITYWVSEPDNGIYAAMNKGIAVAKGEYCLFLNSGDTFYCDDILEKVTPLLTTDFVCGNAAVVGSNSYTWTAPDIINDLFWLQRFSICHQSTFIRTALLKERPYNESLRIVGDYEQMAYEFLVNHRSYSKVNFIICNYGCDGISANHEKSDREKIHVLDEFWYNGFIADDELLLKVKRLKPGTKRYMLAKILLKLLR